MATDFLEALADSNAVGLYIEEGISMCGGEAELYREVLASFCDDLQKRLSFLVSAPMDENGMKDFIIQAHAIKNLCAVVGAGPLSLDALNLELDGKAGDFGAVKKNLPAFREKLLLLLEYLDEIPLEGDFSETGTEIAAFDG
ncbi:MAG: hypothetical protein LBR61_11760 [Synergistaceae bacterium]|nr:hypothetical protein [Synergistaceae bacterium]